MSNRTARRVRAAFVRLAVCQRHSRSRAGYWLQAELDWNTRRREWLRMGRRLDADRCIKHQSFAAETLHAFMAGHIR